MSCRSGRSPSARAARQMTNLLGLACEPLKDRPAVPSPQKDAQAMLRRPRPWMTITASAYLGKPGLGGGPWCGLRPLSTAQHRFLMRMTAPRAGPAAGTATSRFLARSAGSRRDTVSSPHVAGRSCTVDTLTARLRPAINAPARLAQVTDPKRHCEHFAADTCWRSAVRGAHDGRTFCGSAVANRCDGT